MRLIIANLFIESIIVYFLNFVFESDLHFDGYIFGAHMMYLQLLFTYVSFNSREVVQSLR